MHGADADLPVKPAGSSETGAASFPAPSPAPPPALSGEGLLAGVDEVLAYGFQPIVSIETGIAHGYEALLRGTDQLGFATIQDFFDCAHRLGLLEALERRLQHKAVKAFLKLPSRTALLFLNMDARLLETGRPVIDTMASAIVAIGLSPDRFCLEIPESKDVLSGDDALGMLLQVSGAGVKLALDDFGQGYSRLRLVHELHPNFVKVDRYFISGVADDPKKRLFLTHLVDTMHVFGIAMIAEGVETESEFRTCKEIGFDFLQGYMIQRPTTNLDHILALYPIVAALNTRERRNRSTDYSRLLDHMETLPVVSEGMAAIDVVELFNRYRQAPVLPVVDGYAIPIGIIVGADLKAQSTSPFSRDPISNKGSGLRLRDLIRPCPTASVDMAIEKILEIFAHRSDVPGVLMVDQGRYAGFLSSSSLLKVLHEKTVADARNENPLTRLPAIKSIGDWVTDALADREHGIVLAYFDFDNFKPFNDAYGFRNGDRAIRLFAEPLQKHMPPQHTFVGHVGGDDFFVGFRSVDPKDAAESVARLLGRFARDVESFYDAAARERGYLETQGRDGRQQRYRLLTCSAGVLTLRADREELPLDAVMDEIARLRKKAKVSPGGMAIASLG